MLEFLTEMVRQCDSIRYRARKNFLYLFVFLFLLVTRNSVCNQKLYFTSTPFRRDPEGVLFSKACIFHALNLPSALMRSQESLHEACLPGH